MSQATILDVARKAGVSPSTVTHALNGKRPVSDETKGRIQKAIKELGYVANHSASHMRSGKSGIIGCYAADITENFVNQIVRGIERSLIGSDFSLLFASGVELGYDSDVAFNYFCRYDIDGLLLCNHLTTDRNTIGQFSRHSIPVVSINREISGIPSIIPDNYSGGRQAAEHLVSSGMQHPAMIKGPTDRDSSIQRELGFRDRLGALGMELPDELCLAGDYTFKHGYYSAKKILEIARKIDGIFCANDFIAAGAITAVTEKGLRVPEDLLILGFDNRDFSEFWPISISTFEQPLQEMGFIGAGMLRSIIDRGESGTIPSGTKLQSRLIVRESTSRRCI